MRSLALALLVGCAKPPAVPQPSAACEVAGTVELPAGTKLSIQGVPRVRFRGVRVAVAAKVSGADPVPVVVRTSPSGPSLRFTGTLTDLPLRSTRELPILPGHVWIAAGAPLKVSPGLRVTSSFSEGVEASADATCDALALTRATTSFKVSGTGYHLAGDSFALFDAPNGRKLIDLRPRSKQVFTLWVERVERGYAHVVHHDWISLDGWVKQSELLAGEAADCDDCRGWPMDVEDMCPEDDGESDADGCVPNQHPIARIAVDTDLLDDAGAIVGVAERGTEVLVLERKGERVRIVTPASPMLPVSGGWWVVRSALPGP